MLSCLKYSTHKGTNKSLGSKTTYTVLFIKDSILSANVSIERTEDQNYFSAQETKFFLLSLMFHNHTRWRWYLPVVNFGIIYHVYFLAFRLSQRKFAYLSLKGEIGHFLEIRWCFINESLANVQSYGICSDSSSVHKTFLGYYNQEFIVYVCCDIESREEVVIITKCGKNEIIEFGFQK